MPKKRNRTTKARKRPKRKVAKTKAKAGEAAPEEPFALAPPPAQAPAAEPAPVLPEPEPAEATTPTPATQEGGIRAGLRNLQETFETLMRQARIDEEHRRNIEHELEAVGRLSPAEVAAGLSISQETAKYLIEVVHSLYRPP